MLATKVPDGEDMIEGYDLHVGGGAGAEQRIGRLVRPGVAFAVQSPRWCWRFAANAGMSDRERRPRPSKTFTAAHSDEDLDAICDSTMRAVARHERHQSAAADHSRTTRPSTASQRAWLNGFLAGLYRRYGRTMHRSPRRSSNEDRLSRGTTPRWKCRSA